MLRARRVARTLVLMLALCIGIGITAQAATVRHYVLSQWDWNANLGLIFEFYNDTSSDDIVAQAKTMQLNIGLGDGSKWRFINGAAKWELNKEYVVQAIVDPDKMELYIDGKRKGVSKGTFQIFDGMKPLVNGVPEVSTGQQAYAIFIKSIKATTNTKNNFEVVYTKSDFEPGSRPTTPDWQLGTDDTKFTIDLAFEIISQ